MKYIDLHTHSNASDGTSTPSEVVTRGIEKGLAAIALTDHDTVAGVDEALQAAKESGRNIQVIPGTELSVAYKKSDIHIVGLCIDHHSSAFQEMTNLLIERRIQRNEKMIANLQDAGIAITMDDLTAGNPDTVVTRAHFARFLVDSKVVSSPKDAFSKYLDTTTPYYVPREYIQPEEGIDLIRQAGGVPILAHPLHYKLPQTELETLVERLKQAGLMGIEVMYSNHMGQDETYAKHLAKKFELLPSGGSDFHGSNKPAIDIGTGRGNLRIPYIYLEDIAASCNYPLSTAENGL